MFHNERLSIRATAVAALMVCATAIGQTNPAAQTLPVSQNWGSVAFSTMPAGFAAWNGVSGSGTTTQTSAESSTPTGDSVMLTTTPANGGTGRVYGYVVGSDARLGILQSSNATDGASQLAMALNTLGQSNITLDFDYINIMANPRTIGSVVQYRNGTGGAWTTISGTGNPYVQTGGTAGTVTHVTLALPPAAENQAVVQIRWATWRGTQAGNSSGLAIDNIVVNGSGGGGGGSAPVAYAGPDRTIPMVNGALPIVMTDATINDVDGLTGVTYAWTPVSGTGIVSWINRTGSVADPTSPSDATVTVNTTGTYVFTLTATDPENRTHASTVTITVTAPTQVGPYDPPATYYDPARPGGVWLTGASLKTALNGIISGHTVRSYDAAKQALQLLDLDPNNSSNVILVYTGISVPKAWDGGNTWNREHVWPDSLNGSGAADSDLFDLRACNPSVNSTRGNLPYGLGSPPTYWDPNQGNIVDRGAVTRACFYMATRYSSLTLINGSNPGALEMGDLATMLVWHYEQPVTTTERRRNHLIYSSVDNPTYYQGNRNPFIDHPELVWSVFGSGPNNSVIFLGTGTAPANGSSTANVNFTVITGAALPSSNVTLTKYGSTPTTYTITPLGAAAVTPTGPRQAFIGGSQSRTLTVSFDSTSTVGARIGTISIDNTDITSISAGTGSQDGDDTINVTGNVLAHSNASWSSSSDVNSITLDFGTQVVGTGLKTLNTAIHNLNPNPGFTANLDIVSRSGTGNTTQLYTNIIPTTGIAPGGNRPVTVTLDTSTVGPYSATWTINTADQSLPGATNGTPITLTLTANVVAAGFVPPDFDQDGDVDDVDFAHFDACLSGANIPLSPPTCSDSDFDGDTDVDHSDFGIFQRCYSGTTPAVIGCNN